MSGNPEQLREMAISQRKSPEQFIIEARSIHGEKYQYPDLSDIRAHTKIRIVCPIHGDFIQAITNHLYGSGCPKCAIAERVGRKISPYTKPNRRTSNEVLLKRFRETHGNRYQYPDLLDPIFSMTSRTKFRVVCPIHGVSYQLTANHLRGCGCNKCGIDNGASQKPTNTRTASDFLKQTRSVHGDKYQYPDLSDVRSKTPIRVVCPIHGEFLQQVENHFKGGCGSCASIENGRTQKLSPEIIITRLKQSQGERYDWYEYPEDITTHTTEDRITVRCKRHNSTFSPTLGSLMDGSGCPKCALGIEPLNIDPRNVTMGRRTIGKLTWDVFLERAKLIHGTTKYTYSEPDPSQWKGMSTKLIINCPFHGDFVQTADIHIGQGSGCPRCKSSKGERLIGSMLEKASIQYEFQKTFPDLIGDGGKPLRIDFFVPSLNLIIEYDGAHHFKPVNFGTVSDSKAISNHGKMKRSDMFKERFAKVNGMVIIRVYEGEPVESIADKMETVGITFPIDSGIRIPPPLY